MSLEIRQEDYDGLARKLEGLDLTPSEKLLLNAIIENANDENEVAGFGVAYDGAAWLLNQNVTASRVQIASRWSVGPITLA